jgi:hypothetical protein
MNKKRAGETVTQEVKTGESMIAVLRKGAKMPNEFDLSLSRRQTLLAGVVASAAMALPSQAFSQT